MTLPSGSSLEWGKNDDGSLCDDDEMMEFATPINVNATYTKGNSCPEESSTSSSTKSESSSTKIVVAGGTEFYNIAEESPKVFRIGDFNSATATRSVDLILDTWMCCDPNGIYVSKEQVMQSYAFLETTPLVNEGLTRDALVKAINDAQAKFHGVSQNEQEGGSSSSSVPENKISFLFFWRAIGQLVLSMTKASGRVADRSESLFLELEIFRDRLLYKTKSPEVLGFLFDNMEKELEHALNIATDDTREYWENCRTVFLELREQATNNCSSDEEISSRRSTVMAEHFEPTKPKAGLTLEELTILLLAWLNDAVFYVRNFDDFEQYTIVEESHEANNNESFFTEDAGEFYYDIDKDDDKKTSNKGLIGNINSAVMQTKNNVDQNVVPRNVGVVGNFKPISGTVRLHVYDVSQESFIKKINRVTANKRMPLKLGGIFHAGVEINGLEWSYGATCTDTACGIACNEPKEHPQHRYRQTIHMGVTSLSSEDVAEALGEFIEMYPGDDYDLFRRNCCHFADEFCVRLGVGHIPSWIHRFARIAASLDTVYTATGKLFGRGE